MMGVIYPSDITEVIFQMVVMEMERYNCDGLWRLRNVVESRAYTPLTLSLDANDDVYRCTQ
jgi:hypothetical protein